MSRSRATLSDFAHPPNPPRRLPVCCLLTLRTAAGTGLVSRASAARSRCGSTSSWSPQRQPDLPPARAQVSASGHRSGCLRAGGRPCLAPAQARFTQCVCVWFDLRQDVRACPFLLWRYPRSPRARRPAPPRLPGHVEHVLIVSSPASEPSPGVGAWPGA